VKPPAANRFVGILSEVADYYSAKLVEHGETALGVDWNGRESQYLRFEQLAKIIQQPREFSVNDLGCGYGAFLDYLSSHYSEFSYGGCDASTHMVAAARARHEGTGRAKFVVASEPPEPADYGVASGIFNVRLGCRDVEWHEYLEATLDILDRTSHRAFAFNCLTTYSDPDRMREHLYYANPGSLFDLCMRRYSRHIALLHDYGLYEFTILVRKNT
jgi:SAM-dependent methyltransferase